VDAANQALLNEYKAAQAAALAATKELEENGWTVTHLGGGYYCVVSPDKNYTGVALTAPTLVNLAMKNKKEMTDE
jgi:DNA-binding transcriptional MocR family regulator